MITSDEKIVTDVGCSDSCLIRRDFCIIDRLLRIILGTATRIFPDGFVGIEPSFQYTMRNEGHVLSPNGISANPPLGDYFQ